MAEEQKYMDLAYFIEGGYLHEVNRLVLHPAGLALEATRDAQGRLTLSGVWDEQHQSGGIILAEIDEEKIDTVARETAKRAAWRMSRFGFSSPVQDKSLSDDAYEKALSGHFDEKGKPIADKVPAKKSSRKRSTRKKTRGSSS